MQSAENSRRLLTGQRTLRRHAVVADTVDIALLDRDLHGFVENIARIDIREVNIRLFGKAERTVNVAHELPARDLLIRLVVAGGCGRIHNTVFVQLGNIGFGPVAVNIRSRKGSRHGADQQRRCQYGGKDSFRFQSYHLLL